MIEAGKYFRFTSVLYQGLSKSLFKIVSVVIAYLDHDTVKLICDKRQVASRIEKIFQHCNNNYKKEILLTEPKSDCNAF